MKSTSLGSSRTAGLIVDTNLLVLFAVGSVNRGRIEEFKRTRKYTAADYDLLVRVFEHFDKRLFTVPHVLAEVSNLTDLSGDEGVEARLIVRGMISVVQEVEMPSIRAAEDELYEDLGLADAAIGAAARVYGCEVLTDDFQSFLMLSAQHVNVFHFTICGRRTGESRRGAAGLWVQPIFELPLTSSVSHPYGCLANGRNSCFGTPGSKHRRQRASYNPAAPTTIRSSDSTSR